eukprot:c21776_g1_i1 orf=238-402(-)
MSTVPHKGRVTVHILQIINDESLNIKILEWHQNNEGNLFKYQNTTENHEYFFAH